MKARIITALIYIAVLVATLLIRILFDQFWAMLPLDLIALMISILGTYEFLRATNMCNKSQKAVAYTFCTLAIPLYVFTKKFPTEVGSNLGVINVVLLFVLCVIALVIFYVFLHDNSTLKGMAMAIFDMLYVGAMSLVISMVNHFQQNAIPAILLMLIVTPVVDCFAMLTGMLFGKILPYKMAPKISPKKTVVGSVGGVVGGMVAGLLTYFIIWLFEIPLVSTWNIPDIVLLMILSIPISIIGQFGDLFESAIKRECNIKDMGDLLPGHGGILDRFDSTLFNAPTVALLFIIVAIF